MSTQIITPEIQNRLIPFQTSNIISATGSISGFKAWCMANGHDYDGDKEIRKAKSPQSILYRTQKLEARPVLRQLQAAVVADSRFQSSKLEFCTKKDKVTGNRVFNGKVKMTLELPTKADQKAEAGNAKLALEAKLATALARLAELEAQAAQAAK